MLNDSWQMIAVLDRYFTFPAMPPGRLLLHDGICLITAASGVAMIAFMGGESKEHHDVWPFNEEIKVSVEPGGQPQPSFSEKDLLAKGVWLIFSIM